MSGAGMLDFESCFSLEKLVIDADIVGMAKRLVAGVEQRETPIALELIREVGHEGKFLNTRHTRRWFREEQYLPSSAVDRDFRRDWEAKGSLDATKRAHRRAERLIAAYEAHPLPEGLADELECITLHAAQAAGMDKLPNSLV